jgi:hypothetical protein
MMVNFIFQLLIKMEDLDGLNQNNLSYILNSLLLFSSYFNILYNILKY